MGYLTMEETRKIARDVDCMLLSELGEIENFKFDSLLEEYNEFFASAYDYEKENVSKIHILLHRASNIVLGYMTLSADSIKLKQQEKEEHCIRKAPFLTIPALKVGKLAVNREIPDELKMKGYGSFLLELAKYYALELNDSGIACRFLTVDADIEHNADTVEFYRKNGFVENLANKSRKPKHSISMRLDILN